MVPTEGVRKNMYNIVTTCNSSLHLEIKSRQIAQFEDDDTCGARRGRHTLL